jgi:alanine racemase
VSIKNVKAGEYIGYGLTYRAPADMKTAVLRIGYADGYPRALSNAGRVIINGSYAKVAGRVSMDLTVVDITHIKDAGLDDEAVVLGESGGLCVSASELARLCGTIEYEIITGFSNRVKIVMI